MLLLVLVASSANAVLICESDWVGDGTCDHSCMALHSALEADDCAASCAEHCAPTLLNNQQCDEACRTWDCGWDQGECSACQVGCDLVQLGDGTCDIACFNAACDWDLGDCSQPLELYVNATGAQGNGTSEAPFNDFTSTAMSLFMPDVVVNLLAGTHYINPNGLSNPVLLSQRGLNRTWIQGDSKDTTALQITHHYASFSLYGVVIFSNLKLLGALDIKTDCWLPTCVYCPYTRYSVEAQQWLNDREEAINITEYATQNLCDQNHENVLFTVQNEAHVTFEDVVFTSFRTQAKALILNNCGEVVFRNFRFERFVVAPSGLKGGVILHECLEGKLPYCGSLLFERGEVLFLNDGYEYRSDIALTGLMAVQGVRLLNITNVTFRFSFAMVGQAAGAGIHSALIFVTNFRQMEVSFCTFEFGIADVSAAIYVKSEMKFPLVVQEGVAQEQLLPHLVIRDSVFLNNTSQAGAVLQLSFAGDNVNIKLERLTLIDNYATQGVILINCAEIRPEDAQGLTTSIDGVTVFLPPRSVLISQVIASSNLAETVFKVTNVANFQMQNCSISWNGESFSGTTDFASVLAAIIATEQAYMRVVPSLPVQQQCAGVLVLTNVSSLVYTSNALDGNYCPNGVSGVLLSGSVDIVDIHHNEFINGVGSGALTLVVKEAVLLTNLIFRNNTNLSNKSPVCLDIRQLAPSVISVTDSVFDSNIGWSTTVASAFNTRHLNIQRITMINNTALYTCAGILFAPYSAGESRITLTNCTFAGNHATSGGVVTVMDYEELLSSHTQSTVQIQVSDSLFADNWNENDGAGIFIGTYIRLQSDSYINNCVFTDNKALKGAAIAVFFLSGSLAITSSSFVSNSATFGAALYLSHSYTVDIHTNVTMKACYFRSNTPDYAIEVQGSFLLNEVYGSDNLFETGTGAYTVFSGLLREANSVIRDQSNTIGGAMRIQMGAQAHMINVTMFDNSAESKGGAFLVSSTSVLTINNCDIYGNLAGESGGVVYADRNSIIAIEASTLHSNSAQSIGSVLVISPGEVTVRDSLIYGNHASFYAALILNFCSAVISNVQFRNNTSDDDSPGIFASTCHLNVSDSSFEDQTGRVGGFFSAVHHNVIHITSSVFRRGHVASQGGAIYAILETTIEVQQSRFENCTSGEIGGAFMLIEVEITLTECEFVDNFAGVNGGGVYSDTGSVVISKCTFSMGGLYLLRLSEVIVSESTFSNGANNYGGAIEISNVQYSLISANHFADNVGEMAGAIWLYSEAINDSVNLHTVTNNTFHSNLANKGNGGAVGSNNVYLDLYQNLFESNIANATGANGGAVAVACQLASWCNITIHQNEFRNNKANYQGGALFWTDSFPIISDNRYQGNTAKYGPDVASHAVKLSVLSSQDKEVNYIGSHESYPLSLQLARVASGQKVSQTFRFGLFDHLRQLIVTDFVSSAQLIPLNNSFLQVSGALSIKAEAGVFVFSEFTPDAVPLTTQYLMVTTNGVDVEKKGKARDPVDYVPTILIQLSFRECVSGESLHDEACVVCPKDTYSFDPSRPCLLCPSSAICYGNDTMVPKAGYWRMNNHTDFFVECLHPEACSGSQEPPFLSLTGLCAEGYFGNLCQQCLTDYSRTGRFQCTKCPNKASNISISTLIIIAALIVLALIVWTAINSALKPQSLIATYIKIFTNYLQMVVVSASLNLNWPDFAKTFLNSQEMAGGLAEQMFSFECLFQDTSTSQVFYTKLRTYAVLPLALFLLTLLTWGLLLWCKKVDRLARKIVASIVIILFILHPSLTKAMFSLFACMDLGDGQLWLINDLSITCWEQSHVKEILTVVVPSMAVYVFGLPLLSLCYLAKKRLKLESIEMKMMLCFLYKGYQRKQFYWEFVILYRKVLMIAASVFLASVSITVQSLTVLAILLLSLFLQILINPFYERSLNRLEVKSILVSAVTIYAGLYYATSRLNPTTNIVLFVIMILANVYFLFSWIRVISPVLLRTLRDRFSALFHWGKRYRVHAANAVIDSPDKVSSSMEMFPSDVSYPRISSVDASGNHSHLALPGPPNTSALQRENSEESKEMPHYTFEGS